MTTLASLAVSVALAQALAAPEARPAATQARPPAPEAAAPVDEVVVTAPKPEAPTYGVEKGRRARPFEAEARRKAQMRRYRETGSLNDYPGLRCAVFRRC